MDEAYVKDLEAFSNGEVVDNRLKMIRDVERSMKDTDFARWFAFPQRMIDSCLSCGLIPVLAKWIRPGAHGNLPFSRVGINNHPHALDPLWRIQRAAGAAGAEEQHQGGQHGGAAGEAVDEQEGDGGEPRDPAPDHREVAATGHGHVGLLPRGGERGSGGHCRVEEGVPVCGESPPHQGMLDLGRTVTISHSGAGGEIDLCDDAKVRALWEYDRQGRAESLRE